VGKNGEDKENRIEGGQTHRKTRHGKKPGGGDFLEGSKGMKNQERRRQRGSGSNLKKKKQETDVVLKWGPKTGG